MAKVNVKNEQQVETLNKQEAFFMKYKKAIIIAVVAIIAIVAGTILYNNLYKQPHEAEASTVLAKGQELFMSGDFEKALNGDKAGFGGFLKVASDYSGTKAGNLAELYAGLCYRKLGQEDKARGLFNKLINYGKQHIYDKVVMDYFAVSLPDLLIWEDSLDMKNLIHCKYMLALGYYGMGNKEKALKYLAEVETLDNNHQGVQQLRSLIDLDDSCAY